MTSKRLATPKHSHVSTFRLGAELLAAMNQLEERDGIPHSEQARRALVAFLTAKGFPPAKPSAGTLRSRKAWDTIRAAKGPAAGTVMAHKAWDTIRAKKGTVR